MKLSAEFIPYSANITITLDGVDVTGICTGCDTEAKECAVLRLDKEFLSYASLSNDVMSSIICGDDSAPIVDIKRGEVEVKLKEGQSPETIEWFDRLQAGEDQEELFKLYWQEQ